MSLRAVLSLAIAAAGWRTTYVLYPDVSSSIRWTHRTGLAVEYEPAEVSRGRLTISD